MNYLPNIIFAIALVLGFGYFAKNVKKLVRNIKLGQDVDVSDNKSQRWRNMAMIALGQSKMVKRPIAGILHIIVYVGFIIGIIFTLFFSTNFADLISVRIAIGSGTAFMVAQLLDVQIFDYLRKKKWFVAPLTSSLIGSTVDTFLFFSISFYATGIPWVTLSLGDLAVKIFVALAMLIPFRLLLGTFKASKA